MELDPATIDLVIHPTAAYLEPGPSCHGTPAPRAPGQPDWDSSQLNPKNRIDTLEPPRAPMWRIDGCTSFGSQFYAVPTFMDPITPMRFDVFTPDLSCVPQAVRDVLELDQAFHIKDAGRLAKLAISNLVVRRLDLWVKQQGGVTAARNLLSNKPFGSRIVFDQLSLDIRQISITLVSTHALETSLLTFDKLRDMWQPLNVSPPPSIDVSELHLVKQIHDSTCLVRAQGELYIMKALTSYPKYLYHELRLLLTMKAHPNILERPVHLVTKKVAWGGKRPVIGFTLVYHKYGTLRDEVPRLEAQNMLPLRDKFKWALQVTSALLHHKKTSGTFYPDLRLDNIVLSGERNAIMVDFEQRGVWCEFAAPEINAIEYVRIIATHEDVPDVQREACSRLLETLLPGYEGLLERDEYTAPEGGYNVSWLALNPREQEGAEVYMLARVIWCLFEGVSAPQKATIWVSYPWESQLQFPDYNRTPAPIRDLIDECTKGRRPTLDTKVTRRGDKMVLQNDPENSTSESVRSTAKAWWTAELKWAHEFLKSRNSAKERGIWSNNPFERPSLEEVLRKLQAIQRDMGTGSV